MILLRALRRLIVCVFPLLGAACLGAGILNAEETIKIGWIGPLSGSAAVLGMDGMPAAQLAVDEINSQGGINGTKLSLIVEDDQYSSPRTVSAYNKLVKLQGVKILMVVTYSGLFAIAPLAEKDGVILIDPLDCDENIGALPMNTFCSAKTTEDLGYAMADEILRENRFPLGVIYFDGDAFMGTVNKALMARVKEHGDKAIVTTTYDNSTADFKPLLLKLKAANPAALALLGYDQLGTALKQARELGIDAQVYALTTLISEAGRKLAGDSSEGARVVAWFAPPSSRLEAFRESLTKRLGRKLLPDVFVTPAYDITYLLASLLKKGGYNTAQRAVDAAKLRELLYGTRDFVGVSGKFSIDEKGMARGFSQVLIKTLVKGELR